MDSSFLKALAQAKPDPGGGAAAAHAAALGLALLEKVVRLEQRRKTAIRQAYFSWDDLLQRVHHSAHALARLQQEDILSYFKLVEARGSGDPLLLATALEEAIGCPLRIMQQAQEILALVSPSGSRCQRYLVSDLLVSCELEGAAFRGAHHIAQANLKLMTRNPRCLIWAEDINLTLKAAEAMLEQVSAELLERQICH